MSDNGSNENLITLSTGVVLGVKKVNRSLLADIIARYSAPTIPTFYNADKGREEENPNDPEYVRKLQTYQTKLGNDINNAIILDGTEIESAPEGLELQDNPRWLRRMKLKGYDIDSEDARYLYWVKFVAAQDDADFTLILNGVKRRMGILERDVRFAVDKIRS